MNGLLELDRIFADGSRWTQRQYARNELSQSVNPHSDTATCFCLLGGLKRVTGAQSDCEIPERILYSVAKAICEETEQKLDGRFLECLIVDFNDSACRSFSDIRHVIKRAVEIIREEPAR